MGRPVIRLWGDLFFAVAAAEHLSDHKQAPSSPRGTGSYEVQAQLPSQILGTATCLRKDTCPNPVEPVYTLSTCTFSIQLLTCGWHIFSPRRTPTQDPGAPPLKDRCSSLGLKST